MKLAHQARIEAMLVMSKHKVSDAIMIAAKSGKLCIDLTHLECQPEQVTFMVKWLESECFTVQVRTVEESLPLCPEPVEVRHFYIGW